MRTETECSVWFHISRLPQQIRNKARKAWPYHCFPLTAAEEVEIFCDIRFPLSITKFAAKIYQS